MALAKRTPDLDDDDDDSGEDVAVQRAVARVKGRASEEDDEDDEEEEEETPESETDDDDEVELAPSRAEKKRNRYSELQEESRSERDARIRAEAERDAYRESMARFSQQQPMAQQQRDPNEAELERVEEEQDRLWAQFNALPADQQTAEAKAAYKREARALVARQVRAIVGGQGHLTAAQARQEIVQTTLRQQFPEVTGTATQPNRKGLSLAMAHYHRLLANGAPADDINTYTQACRAAKKEIVGDTRPGAARRPEARAGTRERHTGGGSSGGAPLKPAKRTIKMTTDFKRMATALYPNVDEKTAYKRWANGPGRKLVESGKVR